MRRYIFLAITITLIALASASATINSANIQPNYIVGDKISGTLQIALQNQPLDTKITDSFQNQINIIDFLDNHNNLDFTCSPENCGKDYQQIGQGSSSKTLTLTNEKLIGAVIPGNNIEVTNFKIKANSNAPPSCSSQLSIDLLDNDEPNWENSKYQSSTCGQEITSNCYPSSFNEWVEVVQVPYCEKVNLTQAPAFDIKAFAKKSASAQSGILEASLYNENTFLESCELPSPSASGSQVQCTIPYNVKESGTYYICVSIKEGNLNQDGSSGYQLQASSEKPFCGIHDNPAQSSNFVKEYNIKAHAKQYSSIGQFEINQTDFQKQNQNSLIAYINDYLESQYSRNCPEQGCIIPISITGNNELTLSDFEIRYNEAGSSGSSKTTFTELSKTSAEISSENLTLDLSRLNFTAKTTGQKNYTILLGAQEIASQQIDVQPTPDLKVNFLHPQIIAAAKPTQFIAFYPKENITKLVWRFGDQAPEQTTFTNKITHTYAEIGNYNLEIDIYKGTEKISTTQFQITVESPKNAINSTITDYKNNLNNVQSDISSLNPRYKELVDETGLDLQQLDSDLTSIETEYKQLLQSSLTIEQDYINLMSELSKLQVPLDIKSSTQTNTKFLFDLNNIDVDNLDTLFAEYSACTESECQNAIFEWYVENLDVMLKHETISLQYPESTTDIMSKFTFEVSPKKTISKAYMVIGKDEFDIIFSQDRKIETAGDTTGIELDLSGPKTIEFVIRGKTGAFELPAYFSSPLSELSFGGTIPEPESPRTGTAIILFLILLIATTVAYYFLAKYYNTKYEKHIFKNPAQLHNLSTYIQNAQNKNLTQKQIEEKLKKAGWKSEQINYAFKKIKGKNTGLWLPKFNFFNKKDKKPEKPKSAGLLYRK